MKRFINVNMFMYKILTNKSIFMRKLIRTMVAVAMMMCANGSMDASYISSVDEDFLEEGMKWTYVRNGEVTGSDPDMFTAEVGASATLQHKDYDSDGKVITTSSKCRQVIVNGQGDEPRIFYVLDKMNALYVYDSGSKFMLPVANFMTKPGESFENKFESKSGTVETVGFVYASDLCRKKVKYSFTDTTQTWIYGIGANHLTLSSEDKSETATYSFSSLEMPGSVTLSQDVFESPAFVPSNEYYPEGKRWLYMRHYLSPYDDMEDEYYTFTVTGEKDFYGVTCKRLVMGDKEGNPDADPTVDLECNYNGQVYILNETFGTFMLKYDYNIPVGQEAQAGNPNSEVIETNEVEASGITRKRLVFAEYETEDEFVIRPWRYWVEGIGGNSTNYMYNEVLGPLATTRLEAVYENGGCIFTYADFSKGLSGINGIEPDTSSQKEEAIYNLKGLRLTAAPKGEPYIEGGKLKLRAK